MVGRILFMRGSIVSLRLVYSGPSMTTPSVNIIADKGALQKVQTTIDCNGNETSPVVTTVSEYRLFDGRPASVSNPKTASGWRNPSGWNRHKVVCTTYPRSDVKVLTSSGCPSGKMHGYRGVNAVSCPFNQLSNLDVPGWIKDVATTRAYNALKNAPVNLGVAFAERHETAKLVANAATRIARDVKRFRSSYPKLWPQVVTHEGILAKWSEVDKHNRLTGRKFSKWGKGVPNAWLELQYGWNPLMSDIDGACKALSKKERNNDAYTAHVKGTCHTTENDTLTGTASFIVSGAFTVTFPRTLTASAKCGLWYVLDNPVLATFSSLGLTNPLEIVWERVKFSFVVDWFLPVSSWLSTLDADFGWKFKAGFMSTFARTKGSYSWHPNFASGYQASGSIGDSRFDGFIFNRANLVVPPGVGLPHFKNPFSAKHLANAMSLLVQAFKH